MPVKSDAITLLQLNERIRAAVEGGSGLQNVWVTAETSDLRVVNHCYTELIQKDPDTGTVHARLRAAIWAGQFHRINAKFYEATGQPLASGMKVMLRLTVSFHPQYGLSAVVTDIEPSYTLGDLLQRRARMLARLRAEGVADMNKELPWPSVALRVAVVSARGAAGYGDFIHQLYTNPMRLAFSTELFTATLQGEAAPASVVAALDRIATRRDEFDCVVIIRGGGATGDLASFDDYDLASNVAQFPLPVIVGIGHERDVTILDYVANMRVKTPTAAAEWLVARGEQALGRVYTLGQAIARSAGERISAQQQLLARLAGLIPPTVRGVIERNRQLVGPRMAGSLAEAVRTRIARQTDRLASIQALLEAISPEPTLRRGFSITRVAGQPRALTDPAAVAPGTKIETTLWKGTITSTTD